jgi:GNAT superfamily N-acetyltransferase
MKDSRANFEARLATDADIPTLHALIEASVRVLQASDYTPAQIEGALGTVLGLDTQLIADQTYYVIEALTPAGEKVIAACGGWSKRKTLFGSDHATSRDSQFLNPAADAAKIRAFFVHPDWARRGLGTLLLETCENAAKSAGFLRFEMGSTLTGVPLYKLHGYQVVEPISVPLRNGESLPVIRMAKSLPPAS